VIPSLRLLVGEPRPRHGLGGVTHPAALGSEAERPFRTVYGACLPSVCSERPDLLSQLVEAVCRQDL